MGTSIFVPDPFLAWLMKWSTRSLAVSCAIGIIAFVVSIVFRALALMIDTLHGALHSCLSLWISLVHVYSQTGYIGQWFVICGILVGLLLIIYRSIRFLALAHQGGAL